MSGAEEAVRRVGGQSGCDVTVDAIGNCEVVDAAIKCLKRMGRFVVGVECSGHGEDRDDDDNFSGTCR